MSLPTAYKSVIFLTGQKERKQPAPLVTVTDSAACTYVITGQKERK
jgi:hypothetical protein